MQRPTVWLLLLSYIAVIVGANWAIEHFGFVPVGFGLMAPAGVFFAGAAFELRDLLQDAAGRRLCILAILLGAAASFLVAKQFAVASAVAFLLGEFADFAVYTPLRKRFWLVAMLIANPVGDLVDSLVFLALAFGSLQFWQGQWIGKEYMTLIPVGLIWIVRTLMQRRQTAQEALA